LQELSLRNNKLTGEIPGSLGKLANLQELSLPGNQFRGVKESKTRLEEQLPQCRIFL